MALPDGAYLIEPFKSTEFRNHQKAISEDSDEKDFEEIETNGVRKRRRRRSISVDMQPHLIFRAQPRSFDEPIEKSKINISQTFNEDTYENNTEWIDITRKFYPTFCVLILLFFLLAT